jgi:hypothetical protein
MRNSAPFDVGAAAGCGQHDPGDFGTAKERVAMSSRRTVLLAGVVAAFACEVEETSSLEVAVRVEPPAEAPSFPAQVLLGFSSSGSGFVVFRVGFLCAPDASFFTTVILAEPGDAPGAVDAFLVPVERGSAFTCGPLATPQPVMLAEGSGTFSRTSARLEVVGGCGAGDVRAATLVVGGRRD